MTVSRETCRPDSRSQAVCRTFNVPRETHDRFLAFEDMLKRWNRRINLVSHHDEPLLWSRHIADALQLVPLMPTGPGLAIDLGSGAGFPGLILAIATGIRFTLVEADSRKAAFLREAARETNAPVTVHVERIERANLPPVGLITARALAKLSILLDFAAPLLTADGVCLFPKGEGVAQELTDAEAAWRMRVERHPSRIDPNGVILRISEVTRV